MNQSSTSKCGRVCWWDVPASTKHLGNNTMPGAESPSELTRPKETNPGSSAFRLRTSWRKLTEKSITGSHYEPHEWTLKAFQSWLLFDYSRARHMMRCCDGSFSWTNSGQDWCSNVALLSSRTKMVRLRWTQGVHRSRTTATSNQLQHNLLLMDCWWTAACREVPWKSQAGAFFW